jgi:serine O-acetyltransferase
MSQIAEQLEDASVLPLRTPGFVVKAPALDPVERNPHSPQPQREARKPQHRRSLQRTRVALSALRLIPHMILLLRTHDEHYIRADMKRWAAIWGLDEPSGSTQWVALLAHLMTFAKEFRNVFYLRLGMKAKVFYWLCPPLSTLELHSSDIGPGLFIQHGGSTIVSAQRIGKNCWINQQVTIGFSNDGDQPIIGDNVKIFAGAKVVGKARIGDNVTVGVNSVVMGKVPSNVTVLGVPAQIVWKAKGS